MSKNCLPIRTAPTLAHVPHAFFGRRGGTSRGPFSSLNLGFHTDDDPSDVARNRGLVQASLGFASLPVFTRQEHKTRVVAASSVVSDVTLADGMVSKDPSQAIGILTADCIPLLVATARGDRVLAVHAGWRGLCQNIIRDSVVAFAHASNAPPESLCAAIGPCIGPCCFEVRESALDALTRFDSACILGRPQGGGRTMANLFSAAESELFRAGLLASNVTTLSICTFCEAGDYFSYRREKQTGRQAAIIAPRPIS